MKHIPTYALGDNRLPERFWRKVTVDTGSGCWVWMAALNRRGYGIWGWQGRTVLVHRVAYEVLTGQRIPEGLTIDHLCGVKRCVNPDHMEVVTRGENTRRYYRQGAYRAA